MQDLYAFGDDAYCVVREALDHDVSTVAACVAQVGKPMRPVHLVLRPGVRVHGTLTVGKENRPAAAKEPVTLIELDEGNYAKLPKDERLPGIRQPRSTCPTTKSPMLKADSSSMQRWLVSDRAGQRVPEPALKTDNVKTLFNEGAQEFSSRIRPKLKSTCTANTPPHLGGIGETCLPSKRRYVKLCLPALPCFARREAKVLSPNNSRDPIDLRHGSRRHVLL